MILESIRIENYRSVRDATLCCDSLTALVGANGSGKSSILHAIDLFFAEKPVVTEEDYYDRQTDNPVRITATFKSLSDSAKVQFEDYVQNDKLIVTRMFELDSRKRISLYHGIRMQNPDFVPIYGGKRGAKQIYEDLRKDDYADFPKWTNYEAVITYLREWEAANPDKLKAVPDDGGFFTRDQGFPDRFVRFLYLAPIRDAAEDTQEKNSALAQLMDVAVRNSLMDNKNIRKFTDSVQGRYNKLMHSSGQKELNKLGKSMTRTIKQFIPGAEVDLSWRQTELDIGLPAAKVSLVEDEFRSPVGRAGHGLQRVFIMSMLQLLSEAQTSREEDAEQPALILAIDEPELYQHPNRQRHMSQVLLSLASGGISGASSKTQIIYSTHSPHFVGIDRLDQIRLVRKAADGNGGPKTTFVYGASIGAVANQLSTIHKRRKETSDELAQRLEIIMTPMINEGFFADAVVLVEGESDRVALATVADGMNCSLERSGISIIPCGGKGSLSVPAAIFKHLGIPLYIVWDADYGKKGERLNSVLLSVMEQPSGNPSQPVNDTFACLENDMGDTIERDLGSEFAGYRKRSADYFCMDDKRDVVKKPYAVSFLIKTAMSGGCRFRTLEDIVQKAIECANT